MIDTSSDGPEKQSAPIACNAGSVFVLIRQHKKLEVFLMPGENSIQRKWRQFSASMEVGKISWQATPREVRQEVCLELSKLWSGDTCERFYELQKECIAMLSVFVGFAGQRLIVQLNAERAAFDRPDLDPAYGRLSAQGKRNTLRYFGTEFLRCSPEILQRGPIH
ncbi:MAG: hypothetical protein CL532_06970 [Aestuariivita sp.]|nr:hypothetical protein [Aestuariivita sp.]